MEQLRWLLLAFLQFSPKLNHNTDNFPGIFWIKRVAIYKSTFELAL